jgi:hypothetical protein
MNLRDWAAFEDLALQKDIDFTVNSFKPVLGTEPVPVPKPERKMSEVLRRKGNPVTKETIQYVLDHPHMSNVALSRKMPKHLKVADSTISCIRRGKYNHIFPASKKD